MPFSRWLFLTIPGFVIAAVLLALTIKRLLRTLSGAAVLTLPAQASQTFRLAEPGPYELYIEGRLGTTDFGGLDYALTDPAGMTVPLNAVLFRTTVSTFSRARLQVRSFEVADAGNLTLRISGLRPDAAPDNRILINRPVRSAMILHVVGLVVLGSLMIGSMVATGLLIFGPDRAGSP
jgi:hypothetical protein